MKKEEPSTMGEAGLSTVTPALSNALAASGYRPRTLLIVKEGFKWA